MAVHSCAFVLSLDKYANALTPSMHVVQQESISMTASEEEGNNQRLNTPLPACQETCVPSFPDDPQTIHWVTDGIVTDSDKDSNVQCSDQRVLLRRNRFRPSGLETLPEEGNRLVIDTGDSCIPVVNPQRDNCYQSDVISPVHVENGALLPEFLNAKQVRENFGRKVIREFASDYNEFYTTIRNSDSEHSIVTRTDSNASSGYFSYRDPDARDSNGRLSSSYGGFGASLSLSSSYRSSDLSLSSSYRDSMLDSMQSQDDRNSLGDKQLDVSEPRSVVSPSFSQTVHPRVANTVIHPQLQPSKLLASPPPARKHEVAIKTTNQTKDILVNFADPFDYLQAEFRTRSSSLPSKARAICNQVCNKIRKASTTSSSTSLVSNDSEGLVDTHLSRQMSILSIDQSSPDSSTGE